MTEPRLRDATQAIAEAAIGRLTFKTANGEVLEGIRSVIRGERARIQDVKEKTLWINAAAVNRIPEDSTTFINVYDLRLVITAVVRRRNSPQDAAVESQDFAMNASDYLTIDDAGEFDPTLGLPYVEDMRIERVELSEGPTNEGLAGSAGQVIVRFRARRV